MLYEREDWMLFRNLPSLAQKAGVAARDLPALIVKELVDNALDTGAFRQVRRDGQTIVVEDAGPGLPPGAASGRRAGDQAPYHDGV